MKGIKTLLRETKNLYKWRATLNSLVRKLSIKILVLFKLIYRLNTVPKKIFVGF